MSLMRNAILVAVTACLVVYLPRYLKTPPHILIHGEVAKGFEPVLQKFRENFENGADSRYGGSALAVYHKGKKIIDIWGGFADAQSNQEWQEDTMTIAFSATKGLASIMIAMLVDRGLLDYDKPVSQYWPEFGQKGKDKITVRELMEHKAGLTLMAEPGMTIETLQDVSQAGELMAKAEQQWEFDGKKHGYHALTFGPLTNELLRRVDPKHRTMGQFFAEEIAEPLGIDFHIGLPFSENYRVARLNEGNIGRFWGMDQPEIRQMTLYMLQTSYFKDITENQGEIMKNLASFNNPYFRAVELTSANGIGTARAVAKIYGILAAGGVDPVTKKQLLSKERIDAFMDRNPTISMDIIFGVDLTHTLGMITGDYVLNGPVRGFGHEGAGGQKAWADPKNEIGFSFLSNSMSPYLRTGDTRSQDITETLYECLRKMK